MAKQWYVLRVASNKEGQVREALASLSAGYAAVLVDAEAGPLFGDQRQNAYFYSVQPEYATPTRLDRVGRVVTPVVINGRGPFRFVLDTGANRSVLSASEGRILSRQGPREPYLCQAGECPLARGL